MTKEEKEEEEGDSGLSHRRRIPRRLQRYYRKLERDEAALEEAKNLSVSPADDERGRPAEGMEGETEEGSHQRRKLHRRKCNQWLSVATATRLTLSANLLLFFLKMAASIQSGSLAIISSLVDSTLDLFSGVVIAVTSYLIKHYNPYRYPIGRSRLEPVAILITASVMGTATLQIITTSIEDIATGGANPLINGFSGTIIALTIIIKGILFILCRQVDNPSIRTLAIDHQNDVISNLAALVFGLLGTYVYRNLDPIGAVLLALYIIFNWVAVGYEQLKNLVGHRADRRFLSKLTYLAAEHSQHIQKVDTVRAYSFGVRYLVEVHIVLESAMPLQEAHNIGESLQLKLESLDEVERAFVHLDYEYSHSPSSEHKLPSFEE